MATPEEVVEQLGAKIARQAACITELEKKLAAAKKAEARCKELESTLREISEKRGRNPLSVWMIGKAKAALRAVEG